MYGAEMYGAESVMADHVLPAMRFPPESAALQNRLRTVQDHDRACLLNSGEVRNPPLLYLMK